MHVLAAAAALGLALLCWVCVRRWLLLRAGGTVACSLRRRPGGRGVPGRPVRTARPGRWTHGLGRYEGDRLAWYRLVSLSLRPVCALDRASLAIDRRRLPDAAEARELAPGALVLECRGKSGRIEVAMDRAAVTGFLAWLESAPPGAGVPGRATWPG